jgi:hypothetical protein
MSDLKLDTVKLRDAGTSLRAVAQEFQGANATSTDLGPALGHEGLAATVRDFAVSWDDRREKMVGAVAGLAQACTGIGDGFEGLDTQFAAALRGEQ